MARTSQAIDRREDLDAVERRVTEIEQQLARRPE
jgi:hypothetical protein